MHAMTTEQRLAALEARLGELEQREVQREKALEQAAQAVRDLAAVHGVL